MSDGLSTSHVAQDDGRTSANRVPALEVIIAAIEKADAAAAEQTDGAVIVAGEIAQATVILAELRKAGFDV